MANKISSEDRRSGKAAERERRAKLSLREGLLDIRDVHDMIGGDSRLIACAVHFESPLIGGQERGNRSGADQAQAVTTDPVNEEAQARQVADAGQKTLTLTGHTAPVWGVAFNPDGKRLASASDDQTVKVWDATPKDGAKK